MDSLSNFMNYRRALTKVSVPCLPYFGIFMRDCTFVDVGNKYLLNNEAMNFKKLRLMNAVVNDIAFYQSWPYTFQPIPEMQLKLAHLTSLNEEKLYEFSVLCE